MPDFTKWQRQDFGDHPAPNDANERRREAAEEETRQDLQKPLQQLICDVHEEVGSVRRPEVNLAHALKRMMSMMGRVALEQGRTTRQLIWLTITLAVLTVVLLLLTLVLVWLELRGGHTALEPTSDGLSQLRGAAVAFYLAVGSLQ